MAAGERVEDLRGDCAVLAAMIAKFERSGMAADDRILVAARRVLADVERKLAEAEKDQ